MKEASKIQSTMRENASIDPFTGIGLAQRQYKEEMSFGDSLLSKWEIDCRDILLEFEKYCLGFVEVEEDKWERKVDPVMTEQGIYWLISKLQPIVNRNTILNYYKIEEVYLRTRTIAQEIAANLFINHDQYNLKMADYIPLLVVIESLILSTYMRAVEGKERDYRRTILKMLETNRTNLMESHKKGKFQQAWDKLNIFDGDSGGG